MSSSRRDSCSLGEDVLDVVLDRLGAEEQLVGDLLVGVALGHQPQHLGLPGGQAGLAGPASCPATSEPPSTSPPTTPPPTPRAAPQVTAAATGYPAAKYGRSPRC